MEAIIKTDTKIHRKIFSSIKSNNQLYGLLLSIYYKVLFLKKLANLLRKKLFKRIKLIRTAHIKIKFYTVKILLLLSRNDNVLYLIDEPYESVLYPTKNLVFFLDKSSDPQSYRFFTFTFPFNKIRISGGVQKGNWDKKKLLFMEHGTYIAGRDIIIKESDLSISRENYHWLKLFYDIKKNDYKDSKELGQLPTDEVEVAIDRFGDVCFIDGGHRLTIAKTLELREIPIIINLIHEVFLIRFLKETKSTSITPQNIINYILANNEYY